MVPNRIIPTLASGALLALLLTCCPATQAVAQSVKRPRIQTSARPEQTAVLKNGGAGKAQEAKQTAAAPAAKSGEAASKKTAQSKAQPKKEQKQAKAPKQSKPSKAEATEGASRYLALKNNVAYDAVGVLNLGFEFQIDRKLTIEIPVMWSLWDAQPDHALRTVALQPEVRWWAGSETSKGHYFGLHTHVAWYNMKWDDTRYQDTGRPLLGGGLSYGYKLPLGSHWGAEFSLGLGYANLKYNRYYNIDNGAKLDTRLRHYWGVTRLQASLVYRL